MEGCLAGQNPCATIAVPRAHLPHANWQQSRQAGLAREGHGLPFAVLLCSGAHREVCKCPHTEEPTTGCTHEPVEEVLQDIERLVHACLPAWLEDSRGRMPDCPGFGQGSLCGVWRFGRGQACTKTPLVVDMNRLLPMHGNPRFHSTATDESMNSVIAQTARSVHKLLFAQSVLNKYRLLRLSQGLTY